MNLGITNLNTFIKRAREFGLKQTFYSVFWVKTEDVTRALEDHYLDNIIFVEIAADQKKFYQKFKELYPESEPSAAVYTAYSQSEATYQACEISRQENVNFKSALDSLESIETFDGKLPVISREVQYKLNINRFEQGKLVKLAAN